MSTSPEEKKVKAEDLIAAVQSATRPSAPPAQEKQATQPAPVGGMFRDEKTGQNLWKYVVGNDVIITPKPIEQMTVEDYDRFAQRFSIQVADSNRISQDLTVKGKDDHIAFHWFNRRAKDGKSVRNAQSMGFEPARIEDCEWVAHNLNDADGAITDGDLVLMKIHKARLINIALGNIQKARAATQKESYMNQASASVPQNSGKVGHYYANQAITEFSGLGPMVSNPETTLLQQRG